ncbi:hypothetical protein BGX27_009935 [Mortierella sp. AM989]|nr:hypothetical protein BGX27_009935 [Mortierella sp. AM989]
MKKSEPKQIESSSIPSNEPARPHVAKTKASPILIPEILHLIFSFLSQGNLRFHVSLVCRGWNALAQPLISRSVRWKLRQPNSTVAERNELLGRLNSAHTLTCERGWNGYVLRQPFSDTEIERLEELIVALRSISNKQRPTIKKLHLNVKMARPIWDSITAFLEPLGASLTYLQICRLPDNTVFPWRLVFRLCPGLSYLSLQGTAQLEVPGKDMGNAHANTNDFIHMDENMTLPLKSCTLESFVLTKESFYPFVQACPSLRELRLIDIQPCHDYLVASEELSIFHNPEEQAAFLHMIPEYFPALQSIELSVYYLKEIQWKEIPSCSLNNIKEWSFGVHELQAPTFLFLKQNQAEFSLTSLEIRGIAHTRPTWDPSDEFMPYGPSALVGDLLHVFLCQAPNLLHLKAEGVNIELSLLDPFNPSSVHGHLVDRNVFGASNPVRNRALWACRKLKTLRLRFDMRSTIDNESDENSRKLYGYISRVCPQLEDLLIYRQTLTLGSRSGLCLLSNLTRLRRLQLHIKGGSKDLKDEDLDWIKSKYHYSSRQLGPGQLGNGDDSLTERSVAAKIKNEKLRIESREQEFRELEKLHQKYNIPINQHDIPPSLNRGNPDAKKRTSTGLFSRFGLKVFQKPEGASGMSGGSEGSNMAEGVDMLHWGKDEDVLEYFKMRRNRRDVRLWPEMEYLEIKEKRHKDQYIDELKAVSLIVAGLRPDIEFRCLPLN